MISSPKAIVLGTLPVALVIPAEICSPGAASVKVTVATEMVVVASVISAPEISVFTSVLNVLATSLAPSEFDIETNVVFAGVV